MKSTGSIIVALFFVITAMCVACNQNEKPEENQRQKTVTSRQKVATLDDVETDLPEAPGYKTFYSNCVVCHSPRYIQNQPNMNEKSWSAIVGKMQKTFGAPVSDSAAQIIVQYLVAVKGV